LFCRQFAFPPFSGNSKIIDRTLLLKDRFPKNEWRPLLYVTWDYGALQRHAAMSTIVSASERRTLLRLFKQRGLVVQVAALDALLTGYAAQHDGARAAGVRSYIDRVLDALCTLAPDRAPPAVVTGAAAAAAVQRAAADAAREASHACAADAVASALEVVDIFAAPPWRRPGFADAAGGAAESINVRCAGRAIIDACPTTKAQVFRTRYELMLEKTLRNPRFAPPASGVVFGGASSRAKSPYLQLTAIDSLPGSHGKDCLVLGMLTQLEDDSWFLEDLHGTIQLDLSEAHTTAGLHTECSFVIAQGKLVESMDGKTERRVFKVFAMGTPPMETREVSIQALGKNANMFGNSLDDAEYAGLLQKEKSAADAMFLFLSDVHLDKRHVITGIRTIFQGYLEDDVNPTVVVLMGSFLSHPFGQAPTDPSVLAARFTELGQMIAKEFHLLAEQCMFIIVPSPLDAGPGNILPRPPMPPMITQGFVDALGSDRVFLTSNPCRIRYMTQEIVILREDLLDKMIRHCAVRPDVTDSTFMAEHLVKSIVDQAHLCPLPLSSRPVLWAHDHTLWLIPTPHLVVVADKVDGYSFKYGEATGLNPGAFGSDLSFALYAPAERSCQQCTLDPGESSTTRFPDAGIECEDEQHRSNAATGLHRSSSPAELNVVYDSGGADEMHVLLGDEGIPKDRDDIVPGGSRQGSPRYPGSAPRSPFLSRLDSPVEMETTIDSAIVPATS
jgi:DNA polymerase epsilon subunit 2